MKNLKALLAVGVATVTFSSCSSDRPQYPSYSTYGNPNAPVPVRYSKEGPTHRAYNDDSGYVQPSSAQGTSMYDNRNSAVDMQNALLQLEMLKASNRPVHYCQPPVIVYPSHYYHGCMPTYYPGGSHIHIRSRNFGLVVTKG